MCSKPTIFPDFCFISVSSLGMNFSLEINFLISVENMLFYHYNKSLEIRPLSETMVWRYLLTSITIDAHTT